MTTNGYGHFKNAGREVYAHRASWELHFGPIPEGMLVCHNCPGGDTRRCVNPSHLFLGTQADNMADRDAKGRGARGERYPQHKLTAAAVSHIRDRYASGEATQQELAEEYGIGQPKISRIVHRKVWKHVP